MPDNTIPALSWVADGDELRLRENLTVEQWQEIGCRLGQQGRELNQQHRKFSWLVGAWWNYPGAWSYGQRRAIVSAPGWSGPSYETCKRAGEVYRRFRNEGDSLHLSNFNNSNGLTIDHYAAVLRLQHNEAAAVIAKAERVVRETGRPPPMRSLVQEAKSIRRAEREEALADSTKSASDKLGRQLYSVILADPPWQFEVRSRETGMDRAADNHYQTMPTADIAALKPPAAKNCALFLWGTAPKLPDAIQVVEAWGFEYKTFAVWIKPTRGSGFWLGNAHEPLLIATRGDVPAPAEGTQPLSWFQAPRGRHSEKPDCVYEMIEKMFPNQPKLEMFARQARRGWDSWGNEAPPPADPA